MSRWRTRSGIISDWKTYFINNGGQDSVTRILNTDGDVVTAKEYDPYGVETNFVLSGTGTSNPYSWKGHRLDPETGLIYMRNRYYSPYLGRFMTQDPIGVWADGLNLGNGYAYAANAPQVYWDPYGLLGGPQDPPGGPPINPATGASGPAIFPQPPPGQSGSYTNWHESGKRYHGKGGPDRAKDSADRISEEHKDPHTGTDHTTAENDREGYKQEHERLKKDGGPDNEENYNKRNSPGKKYTEKDGSNEDKSWWEHIKDLRYLPLLIWPFPWYDHDWQDPGTRGGAIIA